MTRVTIFWACLITRHPFSGYVIYWFQSKTEARASSTLTKKPASKWRHFCAVSGLESAHSTVSDAGWLVGRRKDLTDLMACKLNAFLVTIPYHRVRRDGKYDSGFVGIQGYEMVYSTVGGITAPKKIKCRGTDGRQWPQLVKGLFCRM
jgi:hypothetical protein